jgi:uncharacterized MAPEG superfamily protein
MPSPNANPDLAYVVYSAALTWLMTMTASLLRARAWTPKGLVIAFGNRDDLPAPTPLAGRADRAAKNMLENLVLLTAVLLAARASGADTRQIAPGVALFFWARVAYFPVYLAGIPYLRTALWGVSVAGLVIIARAAL